MVQSRTEHAECVLNNVDKRRVETRLSSPLDCEDFDPWVARGSTRGDPVGQAGAPGGECRLVHHVRDVITDGWTQARRGHGHRRVAPSEPAVTDVRLATDVDGRTGPRILGQPRDSDLWGARGTARPDRLRQAPRTACEVSTCAQSAGPSGLIGPYRQDQPRVGVIVVNVLPTRGAQLIGER
jgi:hypothetical protein